MITVRFASGLAITYNEANFVEWGELHTTLRASKEGRAIAFPPIDALIEFEGPCTVTGAAVSVDDALAVLGRATQAELERASGSRLAEAKKRLAPFNRRTHCWGC